MGPRLRGAIWQAVVAKYGENAASLPVVICLVLV
jgi:hypothetical protein